MGNRYNFVNLKVTDGKANGATLYVSSYLETIWLNFHFN